MSSNNGTAPKLLMLAEVMALQAIQSDIALLEAKRTRIMQEAMTRLGLPPEGRYSVDPVTGELTPRPALSAVPEIVDA